MVTEGRTTLNDGGYFCLTVLEAAAEMGRSAPKTRTSGPNSLRAKAAEHFQIDLTVLDKIGNLTGNRGGRSGSRKRQGADKPLTPAESEWLEQALKLLIRRAAEVAHDPTPGSHEKITMGDLPKIP
jgi:hypothetical protein